VDAAVIVISVTAMVLAGSVFHVIRSFQRALSLTDPVVLRRVAAGQVVGERVTAARVEQYRDGHPAVEGGTTVTPIVEVGPRPHLSTPSAR
jgi:hypothetical protein